MPRRPLDAILRPKSIALIGASRQPNTIGWHILDNLLKHEFQGPVYPVNPHATAIHSVPAYKSIADVPGPVDLAVIAVPKEHVVEVVRQCVDAGARGLVVISSGFKEVGGAGIERERELVELVRSSGLRMVGPNCLGVINTETGVRMNATFAPNQPPPGPVGFISQSGAMGLSVLDYAQSLGIGISMFVSSGNKADVSGNDLLEYWCDDPNTTVMLMYIESFGNPRRFVELGRAITRDKPICIVKSGRTGAGQRAAASHTGALAGTELATDAIIAQAGAIRAQTVAELFDLAMAFSNQPLPAGNRVAIVTNAGGPGIILADACEANGLDVPQLSSGTEQQLRSRLPEEASVKNPVDLIASATPQSYECALQSVFDDPNVDAAIAAFVPPLGIQAKDVAEAIVRVNKKHPEKPLLGVLMGREGVPAGVAELHEARVPAYIFPESAARALGAMWRQRQRIDRPAGEVVEFDTDDAAVAQIIDDTLVDGRTKLSEPDALRLLEAYEIAVLPWEFVSKEGPASLATGAAEAASRIGLPVAIKIVSPDITHKTDVGGVQLGLKTKTEVERAVRSMIKQVTEAESRAGANQRHAAGSTARGNAEPRINGILVQQMADGQTETIVGLTRVPTVGPLVMFGLGGIYVEVMRDVVLRLSPLRDSDAMEMVRSVRLRKLLEGVRGQKPRDVAAIAQAILRLSQLAQRHPRIMEMDINPLLALEHGTVAIDARVQVEGASHA
jgi:acetyl coenzyme A synthetase (ADP forming)-like protein